MASACSVTSSKGAEPNPGGASRLRAQCAITRVQRGTGSMVLVIGSLRVSHIDHRSLDAAPACHEIIENNLARGSGDSEQAHDLPEVQRKSRHLAIGGQDHRFELWAQGLAHDDIVLWSRRSEVSACMSGSTISHGWQDPLKNVREFLRQAGFDENRRTSHSLRVRRN